MIFGDNIMIKSIKHSNKVNTYSLSTLSFFNANAPSALACHTQHFIPFASHYNTNKYNTINMRSKYPNRTLPLSLKSKFGGLQ